MAEMLWTNTGLDEDDNPIETEGAKWLPYEMLKFVVDMLYEACVATVEVFGLLAKIIHLVLPSGLALELWDGSNVPDFRLPEKRFWYVSFRLLDSEIAKIPLPKTDLWSIWKVLVAPINPIIDGSDTWYYRDTDGSLKQGFECDPPRSYGILTEGFVDVGTLILVLGIVYILIKSGMIKTATAFVQKVWLIIKTRQFKAMQRETNEIVTHIEQMASDSELGEHNLGQLEQILLDVNGIKNLIGLRMVFR